MFCIECKKEIDRSYGTLELVGCYCLPCALLKGFTIEQIYLAYEEPKGTKEILEDYSERNVNGLECI